MYCASTAKLLLKMHQVTFISLMKLYLMEEGNLDEKFVNFRQTKNLDVVLCSGWSMCDIDMTLSSIW